MDDFVGKMESLTKAISEGANAWKIFISVIETAGTVL